MFLTKKTAKFLCAKASIASEKIPVEANKLLEIYNDPSVNEADKAKARLEIDRHIEKLEKKAETTRTTRTPKIP